MRRTVRGLAIAVPACLVAASIAGTTAIAAPSRSMTVTSEADSGAGSLRAAIEWASTRNGATIQIEDDVDTITLASGLVYSGKGALRIQGDDTSVTAPEESAFTLLTATGGGALTLRDITLSNAGLFGLHVQVPDKVSNDDRDRSDDKGKSNQVVVLDGVTVVGNALHGVYLDDCRGTDEAAGQCATDAPGSDAGISLSLISTTIDGNGFTTIKDFDGVRVDERGKGSISLLLDGSTIKDNSGDGIELDESDEGGVRAFTGEDSRERDGDKDDRGATTVFTGNGNQSAQDPTDPEDGFDIDERGVGDIDVDLRNVSSTQNVEDNLDLNEAGDGDLKVRLKDVQATGGGKRGIDLEEAGLGNLDAELRNVTATGNVDDNIRAQDYDSDEPEDQGGDVRLVLDTVDASGSTTKQNLDIDELGAGDLAVLANRLTTDGSVKDTGVDLTADGTGSFQASLTNLSSKSNKKYGVKAAATGGAVGTLTVTDAVVTGNSPTAFNTDPNVTITKVNVTE